MDAFERERETNPQGVIDSLIKQTTKQASEINRLRRELEEVRCELKERSIDPVLAAGAPF